MAITRLKVANFKSFDELEIELGRFNVLIGPNASGKSNFIQIFKFLRDIAIHGLDNAISMQGGIEYLRNMSLGASKKLYLSITSDTLFSIFFIKDKQGSSLEIKAYETIYEFSLAFTKKGAKVKQISDKLKAKCKFIKPKMLKKHKEEKILGEGSIVISRSDGKIDIQLEKPKNILISEEVLYPSFLKEIEIPKNSLIIEARAPILIAPSLKADFSNIAIYDFDPKLPKKATPITGKAELEEDGSNLSIVLKNLIENKEKKERLFNLVRHLLPFIKDLSVEKFADKSLLFKLREVYSKKKQYLPASLISDGTINITALIIALYFEKKSVTIIEEPERNIHPYLISRIVDMMKDASCNKQIIVTTHNPEVIKYAGLDNILLISRNEEGFSEIYRPEDKEEIKTFLENEIGIEELFVQNLLGS